MKYKDLPVSELDDLLQQDGVVVIDMRDAATRAAGMLPRALEAADLVINELVRNRRHNPCVLVYCYHGNSSRDLCDFLGQMGLKNVYNLVGGWEALEHYRRGGVSLTPAHQQWLQEQGFDPSNLNSRVQLGMSPLMVAALKGLHDLVDALLAAGADPKQVNDDEHHALWFSCVHGDVSLVRKLIDVGSDINNRNVNGVTCAIYAASTGKLDVLKTLIEAGADLGICTHDGVSVLESASTLPVLRFLRSLFKETALAT